MLNHFYKNSFLFFVFVLLSAIGIAQQAGGLGMQTNNGQSKINSPIGGNGISFIPNKGQIADLAGNLRPDILYKGSGSGSDIYLRKTGITYVYSNIGELMHQVEDVVEIADITFISTSDRKQKIKDDFLQKAKVKVHRVDMNFVDCNENISTLNDDEIEGNNNYYYTHCPNGVLNVKQYNKVTYKNIYNNIDIAWYGDSENGLKYDIIVKPHADPNQIKLQWIGVENIQINDKGHLVIKTSMNEFCESMPKIYQTINGKVVDVKASYVLNGTSVSFELGTWNRDHPLIIDPWVTYYGGNGEDHGAGLDTDRSTGDVYMTGYVASLAGMAVAPGFQIVHGGGLYDALLVKFNSSGVRLWATYYGGMLNDYGEDVATDVLGNVYMAGSTVSSNGIASTNGFQQSFGGGSGDGFLVKFNSSGLRLWATYYGGASWDWGIGVATDNFSGAVYLGGYTGSTAGIATASGYQNAFAVGIGYDAYLVKFDATGARLWATYFGGSDVETGGSIATDAAGDVYMTGTTRSLGGIVYGVPVQPAFGGGVSDAFFVKFNGAGLCLWATYYGGSNNDNGYNIAIDATGDACLSGSTKSSNNIAFGSVFMTTLIGFVDVFLAKFSPSGARIWATYCTGTNNANWYNCIAIDISNNIYLMMEAEDATAPDLTESCSYNPVFNGGFNNGPASPTEEDQLIEKFNPAGKRVCATYLGGTGEDDLEFGGGITIHGNFLYSTACTDGNFPVTSGAFQTVYGGGNMDAYIAQLCTNICEGKSLTLNITASKTSVCANIPVTFTPTVTNSCDTTGYKYHWVFAGGTPSVSDSVSPTVTYAGVGTHDVKLIVTTLCKKDSVTQINYITTTQCSVCNLVVQFTKGTATCTACGCKEWVMVTGTGGTSPYSYTWPDGYDKRYKNQLCPGVYTIKVVDKNGCSTNINLTAP